jgi:Lipocalin-like domain
MCRPRGISGGCAWPSCCTSRSDGRTRPLLPISAIAQQKTLKELVGTWSFVSSTGKLADGSPVWGSNPKGQLSFDADGRYSSTIVRSDLAKYASNSRMQTSPAEDKATVQGAIAFF